MTDPLFDRPLVPAAGEWGQFKRSRRRGAQKAKPSPHVLQVIKIVGLLHGYSHQEIVARKKRKGLCRVRSEAMCFARMITGASYPVIAATFARDHSTVIKVVQRHLEKVREACRA